MPYARSTTGNGVIVWYQRDDASGDPPWIGTAMPKVMSLVCKPVASFDRWESDGRFRIMRPLAAAPHQWERL